MAGAKNKDAADAVSRLADSLLGEAGGGGDRPKAGSLLREELGKEIEGEGEALGKFLGLVESFAEIIPEEDRRHSAALKALAQTSGLQPEDILRAADSRLLKLKKLGEGLSAAAESWREDLGALEARAAEMRGRISKLREQLQGLEEEEKEILDRMASGDEELDWAKEAIEKATGDLARDINDIKEKLAKYCAEEAPAKARPTQGDGGRKIKRPSAKGSAGGRTCPNCRGRMDWYEVERTWKCFVCAHEESG
jgi:DNA repair exonuclease SbcCD ATPase subunit